MKSAFLFVVILASACNARGEDSPRKGQVANIVESIFRHQMANHKSDFYFPYSH